MRDRTVLAYLAIIIMGSLLIFGVGSIIYYSLIPALTPKSTTPIQNNTSTNNTTDSDIDAIINQADYVLEISDIDLKLNITDTNNDSNVAYHYSNSAFPGDPGECALLIKTNKSIDNNRKNTTKDLDEISNLSSKTRVSVFDNVASKKYVYEVVSTNNNTSLNDSEESLEFADEGESTLSLVVIQTMGNRRVTRITKCKIVKTVDLNNTTTSNNSSSENIDDLFI